MVEQEDIIEVDYEVSCVNEISKDVVHERLECSGGVAEAKGHDKGFEESEGAFESGFPFVAFANADVIIALTDVKLGKVAGTLGPIQQRVARVLPFLDTCDRESGVFRRVTV
jgi:hypothetical protein